MVRSLKIKDMREGCHYQIHFPTGNGYLVEASAPEYWQRRWAVAVQILEKNGRAQPPRRTILRETTRCKIHACVGNNQEALPYLNKEGEL